MLSPSGGAEALYERFGLSHPSYSARGEWVCDGAIPREHLAASYKFHAARGTRQLEDMPVGAQVFYSAHSGKRYAGTVASRRVIDDHVILSYVDRHGERRCDLGALGDLIPFEETPGAVAVEASHVRDLLHDNFGGKELQHALAADSMLRHLFACDSGTAEGYSIAEHSLRVDARLHRSYAPRADEVTLDTGIKPLAFLRLLAALHDIGKPRAMGTNGLRHQHEHTLHVVGPVLSALGFSVREQALAKAIIGNDDFGRVFNARTPAAERLDHHELAGLVSERAAALGITPAQLHDLHSAFYLADASSYPIVAREYFTRDARGRLVPKDTRFIELEELMSLRA